ncbi:MlaD family protein [Parabacteroides sp. FAFU027]|uniref:MlaD family protein n=1 Tax=Parabacteroides sp. FAFU027 TaxID=2922715 RepID=UPI001FAFAB9F|nr:MlaD family protein [Parabacteroides sp. FAFU027]
MKKLTKEVKIGFAAIISLLLLYYGINYLKGINLMKPANYYYVVFQDVSGLTVSSPVYINGYKAGLVRSFEYDYEHPGHIIVELAMDKELRVSKGTVAEYKSELLGTAAVTLSLNLESHQYLVPGDTIPAQEASGLMKKVEKDMLPKLSQILSRMDTVLAGLQTVVSNPALNKSLVNIETTTAELSKTSASLNKIMSNEVPVVVGNLKTMSNDFSTVSGNLKRIDFAHTMSTMDTTLTNLKSLSTQLNRKDNSLGLLVNDRTFYDNLSATTANANRLMVDLKENPKRYVHFSVFGRK